MLPLIIGGVVAAAAGAYGMAKSNGGGPVIPVVLTGYYPGYAAAAGTGRAQRHQGAPVDRLGRPLHTLQQHKADPVLHPFVSLSGDLTLFKYGQRVTIAAFGTPPKWWQRQARSRAYIGRIVDSGCNFFIDPTYTKCGRRGAVKQSRVPGHEPIDVAVDTPTLAYIIAGTSEMQLTPGDYLDPRTGRRPVEV